MCKRTNFYFKLQLKCGCNFLHYCYSLTRWRSDTFQLGTLEPMEIDTLQWQNWVRERDLYYYCEHWTRLVFVECRNEDVMPMPMSIKNLIAFFVHFQFYVWFRMLRMLYHVIRYSGFDPKFLFCSIFFLFRKRHGQC